MDNKGLGETCQCAGWSESVHLRVCEDTFSLDVAYILMWLQIILNLAFRSRAIRLPTLLTVLFHVLYFIVFILAIGHLQRLPTLLCFQFSFFPLPPPPPPPPHPFFFFFFFFTLVCFVFSVEFRSCFRDCSTIRQRLTTSLYEVI